MTPALENRDSEKGAFYKAQPPQHEKVAASVSQYSRFVQIMKIALPVAAVVLLVVVLVLPMLRQQEERIRVAPVKDANGRSLAMTNARYFGTDDKGQPYEVTAQSVRQGAAGDKVVELTQPKADIRTTSGNAISASASSGIYDHDKREIDLSGEVTLDQAQGKLRTSQAHITLKDGSARGNAKVTGEGSFGKLEASGFSYNKDDKIIRFTGPSRLVLNPKSAKSEATKSDDTKTAPPPGAPK
ncbi:MAG: LPS export ABC transporter periplasmic protein LptC [Rhodospirillaceae bacterium]|nr:LPS export ABC transporter periplasmic protein LptC [Rhodospirillaceae bacterium]